MSAILVANLDGVPTHTDPRCNVNDDASLLDHVLNIRPYDRRQFISLCSLAARNSLWEINDTDIEKQFACKNSITGSAGMQTNFTFTIHVYIEAEWCWQPHIAHINKNVWKVSNISEYTY